MSLPSEGHAGRGCWWRRKRHWWHRYAGETVLRGLRDGDVAACGHVHVWNVGDRGEDVRYQLSTPAARHVCPECLPEEQRTPRP